MIQLEGASRWYGEVIGLNDVTCNISPGVTALLGQNGAGKSTLIKLITGQIRPTTGTVKVFGQEPFANSRLFRRMGLCPDFDQLPEHLSGREFVYRMAILMEMSAAEAKRRTEETLALVGMTDRASRPLRGYSKGMRQRIKLAQAVVHEPEILLLDEPLNGLDPVGRREFMDVLTQYALQGKAVIVSSHILFEVEQMTRSMLLLHRGRLLASGDLGAIRELIDRYPHQIQIETTNPRALASQVMALPFVLSVKFLHDQSRIELETREPDLFYTAIANISLETGVPILSMESPDNNLESVFRYLVQT